MLSGERSSLWNILFQDYFSHVLQKFVYRSHAYIGKNDLLPVQYYPYFPCPIRNDLEKCKIYV